MIVVVGGGLAGLHIARSLTNTGHTVHVFESRKTPGGRIHTDDERQYEAGPWRVARTHLRVIRLLSEMGIVLLPVSTPTPAYGEGPEPVPGLSIWDVSALQTRDPLKADKVDLSTSYADETHAASGSAPYATNTKEYYYAPEGFSRLPERLADGLDMHYDHRVVDVTKQGSKYEVTTSHRGKGNTFSTFVVKCKTLFVCVPPSACKEWTIFREHARSTMNAVMDGQLHHIYAEDERFPRNHHALHPHSLLSQTISSQFESSDYFQISYTGGRVANFWQHLKLQSPTTFFKLLKDELKRVMGFRLASNADIRSHHWPVGYHAWRTVPDFDLQKSVNLSIEPSPRLLPNVYIAGEAFSSHQAWMEGALETADLALERFHNPKPLRALRETDTTVDGCVVNVTKWMHVHPGGKGAISNYKGQDLSGLLSHIGHSTHAWAVAHSLKVSK
jgi:monoamine oxidase